MPASITLIRSIVEELERRASEAGLTIEEYLLDLLARDSDPNTAARGTSREPGNS